ncbi:hypothetical protein A5888_003770 [Enterococcus sp. 9E7_DIV0242]|uniref:DNA-directed RNA polymerase beta subunit n=2 Tax=Candidatus Enterococcus clewellii TaxID=1834193 RepID=A0A242K651_9ENTE|nr:hypothetical protein A5888_001898 [Enterococcus sp. 9E7_DIV0242]
MMPNEIDWSDSYFHDYVDRGIMKWQGMYLSEHTAEMEKEQQEEEHVIVPKEKMSEYDIQQVLASAYESQLLIAIQLEMKDTDNNYFEDVTGKLMGFDELGILVDGKLVLYEEIRHVALKSFHKWSEV